MKAIHSALSIAWKQNQGFLGKETDKKKIIIILLCKCMMWLHFK